MNDTQTIIFTDMDGSLLDHDTYSHADADALLAELEKLSIPVIPCTSKTCAEMEVLRKALSNHHPFVVENGAAVYIPASYFDVMPENTVVRGNYVVKEFVQERQYWQSILENSGLHLDNAFLTFHQAGASKIAEMTGLNIDQAEKANDRQYGEPLKWLGGETEYALFSQYIDQQGGKLLKGGRFIHLSGECDKGIALQWLKDIFDQQPANQKTISIALGDSQNDIAMIDCADYGILIRSPVHEFPESSKPAYRTQYTGSKGWVEGVMHAIDKIGLKLEYKAPL